MTKTLTALFMVALAALFIAGKAYADCGSGTTTSDAGLDLKVIAGSAVSIQVGATCADKTLFEWSVTVPTGTWMLPTGSVTQTDLIMDISADATTLSYLRATAIALTNESGSTINVQNFNVSAKNKTDGTTVFSDIPFRATAPVTLITYTGSGHKDYFMTIKYNNNVFLAPGTYTTPTSTDSVTLTLSFT